ncbi:MAG: iron-containing alcohol dehydrogenase [Bryobacterales bacterium]|nr:iron-containing alcohol dehydrogenase [Bryobacterales bacterium]
MSPPFEFATAARVVFGAGQAAAELSGAVRSLGERALLVTGRDPARWRHLVPGAAEVFAVRGGEPTLDTAREGAALARACGADVVVAVGGGSAIDAGKAIAALAANPGDVLDYLEVIGAGRALERRPLPFLAVPTTFGTGAEVTRNAVLASREHGVKVSLRSAWMLPAVAIVDPELGRGVPREVAVYTGLDALTQLIEPLVSSRANPMSDAVARAGLAAAAEALPTLEVEGMARASLFGGMALANSGLGAVHAFAAAIGGMFPRAPHGAVCAALLAPCLAANLAAMRATGRGTERFDEAARLLTGRPTATAEEGIAWVRATVEVLGARPLRAYGVDPAHAADIVAKAQRASSMKGNPVALTDEAMREAFANA